ncbi:MAG: YpsA SLOG family protein [Burkholderiales bacterium]|mgnify:FL=1
MSRNNRDSRFKKRGKSSSGQSGISGLQSGRLKILTNAQTGVSRGVLDAALEFGSECGGSCAEGRMAEDGFVPDSYPVEELPGADTSDSIRQNVKDSDGTAIIFFGDIEDEPEEALDYCVQLGKTYRLVNGGDLQPGQAGKVIADFIKEKGLMTLNVTGPKSSATERAQRFGYETMRALLGLGPKKRRNPEKSQPTTADENGSAQVSDGDQNGNANGKPRSNKSPGQRRRRGSGRRFPRKKASDSQSDVTQD